MSCLYILEINPLLITSFSNIFSHAVGCLFGFFCCCFVFVFVFVFVLIFFIFLMLFLFAYILFMYVCMYIWLCWVFVSVRGLSLVVASGGHSSSRCTGLSLSRPPVDNHRLQTRRLSNRGSRAESLHGMWDLPRPGLEPASPALAGRFSTTAPPGKPCLFVLFMVSFAMQKLLSLIRSHLFIFFLFSLL